MKTFKVFATFRSGTDHDTISKSVETVLIKSFMVEKQYKNPLVTVDVIIEVDGGIVLIKRKNPPYGWALPGGFVDYNESLEASAIREAGEETGLDIELIEQFHTYSDPDRDPRHHTITTVYIAKAEKKPEAADDAVDAGIFMPNRLPEPIVFDHQKILNDYVDYRKKGRKDPDLL